MDVPSERNRSARCEQAHEDCGYNSQNFCKVKMIIIYARQAIYTIAKGLKQVLGPDGQIVFG